MGYAEKMKECREYIDAHLGTELSAVELAGHFHYSYYHFCRIFQACNGMSVAAYIRDQRLKMAIRKVEAGAGILEAALEVGFETPGGFSKAFKRKYGCTPTEYFKKKASEKEEEKMRQPRFVTLGPVYVMGHGRPSDKKSVDETQDGAYWYEGSRQSHGHGRMKEDTVKIGMWLKEPDEHGNLIYFFWLEGGWPDSGGPWPEDRSDPCCRVCCFYDGAAGAVGASEPSGLCGTDTGDLEIHIWNMDGRKRI